MILFLQMKYKAVNQIKNKNADGRRLYRPRRMEKMKTLLDMINKTLDSHGLSGKDILWVGNHKYYIALDEATELDGVNVMSWEDFAKVAGKIQCKNGDTMHFADGIFLVGNGFWLESRESGCYCWWQFVTPPKKEDFQK